MHLCTCKIALNNDLQQVVHRNRFEPVSWPEIGVLQFIHGEQAIYDPLPVDEIETTPREERERLQLIYGDVVGQIYPGRNPNMEMEMPGYVLPKKEPELSSLAMNKNNKRQTAEV
jgi:hypothetical protein